MGDQYRIRLDDEERHTIVEALAAHLRHRVRATKHTYNIWPEACLLERLAKPKATRPDRAFWAYHWTARNKHTIYRHIEDLVKASKGTVRRSPQGTVSSS